MERERAGGDLTKEPDAAFRAFDARIQRRIERAGHAGSRDIGEGNTRLFVAVVGVLETGFDTGNQVQRIGRTAWREFLRHAEVVELEKTGRAYWRGDRGRIGGCGRNTRKHEAGVNIDIDLRERRPAPVAGSHGSQRQSGPCPSCITHAKANRNLEARHNFGR